MLSMFPRSAHPRVFLVLDILTGMLLCTISAALLILFTRGHNTLRPMVPLFFIGVLVLVGLRFTVFSSLLGALCATALFAYFLFTPVGSFRVQKGQARTNIVWMLMIGVPASYFAWATKVDMHSDKHDHKLKP